MFFKTLRRKFGNYAKSVTSLLTGRPLVIRKFDKFFKIVLYPSAIKQLNREVHNTKLANEWDMYSNRVVQMVKITPFAAMANLIEDEREDTWRESFIKRQTKMIKISLKNLDHVLKAPMKSASEVIHSHMNNLEIDLSRDHHLFSEFKELLYSGYFTYQVPVTPMHGDFIPINAIISENKLFLVDWEYAIKEGSILYDWWYLKYEIDRFKINNRHTNAYISFIDKMLGKMGLTYNKFNAFGYAMHSVIQLSRLELRGNALDYEKRDGHFNILKDIIFNLSPHEK